MINEQGRYVEPFGRLKCDNGMALDVKSNGDYYQLVITHSDAVTQRLMVNKKQLRDKLRDVDNGESRNIEGRINR